MSSSNQTRANKSPARKIASAGLAILSTIAFASVPANAQTSISTTTTLFGGTADWTQFGLASMTAPTSGIILTGTRISTITGKPVRYLWVGDAGFGLCRLDPEVDDSTGASIGHTPPPAGIGVHQINNQSCVGTIQASAFVPGQMAFDGSTNTLYAPAIGRVNAGIIRLHYAPDGDNGNGALDHINVQSLIGTQSGRNAAGGCPQVLAPKTNALVPVTPDATTIGPDGNLYVGHFRDGAIIRILSPATFDPSKDCPNNGASNVTPGPNDKIQIPLLSSDERVGSGHTFGLGWVGHTLLGNDNIAPWVLFNADQCLTPANGNRACSAPAVGGGGAAQMPTEVLAAFAGAPQAAGVSDAQFFGVNNPRSFPGNTYFAANFPSVTKVSNITSVTAVSAATNYGGSFNFITGLTADPLDLTNRTLYVQTDASQGAISGAASLWLVSEVPPAPGPPLAPSSVNANAVGTIGATTGSASVSWTPLSNGQTIDHYIVRTYDAPAAAGPTPLEDPLIPDVTVTPLASGAVPTSAIVSGLTFGVAYEFAVEACNATACSPFSGFSNVMTPTPITVPPAPTNVAGLAGNSQAAVAWTQSSNGGSPITSSTISAFLNGASPAVTTATVTGTATGGTVTGLVNGSCYTFSVKATNAAGTSAASTASPQICLAVPTGVDLALGMASPASINAGSVVPFTITVTNNGPANAAQVLVNDTLPAPLSSFTAASQGVCQGAVGGTAFSCNFGALNAGASATVTVSVGLTTQTGSISNSATVSAQDSLGNPVADTNTANNTGSSTTAINTGGGGTTGVTTDIQVGGSSNNGNPPVNSNVTFTWQIKDNLGTVNAPGVVFTNTLPSTFQQVSITSTQGTCTSAPGQLGGTISCSLGTINGGQTAIVSVVVTPTAAGSGFTTTGNAQMPAGNNDSNPANNSSSVTIQAH